MRIVSFLIENFRNIKLAECELVPDFMIICGGNGCGKSSLLEALMTAKEHAGAYGDFQFDPKAVSADAEKALIKVTVSFSEIEKQFVKSTYNEDCPDTDVIEIEILKGGQARALKRSAPTKRLFSYYSTAKGSPGFFDYITAHRQTQKQALNNWDATFLSDDRAKRTLAGVQNKFQQTKQYLAGLKMNDLQQLQKSLIAGAAVDCDSLKEIRNTFNRFFAPLKFNDVFLDRSPFGFVVETPAGEIDIDDLSSGEKEIFNIFVRFHQLNPQAAVILFDEADAHLHPDLERRYLKELKRIAVNNQVILTTHSPEMMIEAGSENLFTIHKQQISSGDNQLKRVTPDSNLHSVLSELMGSRGLISFNQRVVFIEGEEASADREIYEALFPPSEFNISFVPAGNSSTVRKTAERVNALLTSAIGFQQYFCIVDQDIERSEEDPTKGNRLFRLPVYHIENFLLDTNQIFLITKQMLASNNPFSNEEQVRLKLQELVLEEKHLVAYSKAVFDAEISKIAKQAYDSVWKKKHNEINLQLPDFENIKMKCKDTLTISLSNESWKRRVKGRDLLKAYCLSLDLKYEHFRNSLISSLQQPPPELHAIINNIIRIANGGNEIV